MIPTTDYDLTNDFTYKSMPSKTFKLNRGEKSISGNADKLEAMAQAVYLILNVERYKHLIYSFNYGVELDGLFGMPNSYVIPELQRRITEALTQDERVKSVSNFSFETKKGRVTASFTVNTVFGDITEKRAVDV